MRTRRSQSILACKHFLSPFFHLAKGWMSWPGFDGHWVKSH